MTVGILKHHLSIFFCLTRARQFCFIEINFNSLTDIKYVLKIVIDKQIDFKCDKEKPTFSFKWLINRTLMQSIFCLGNMSSLLQRYSVLWSHVWKEHLKDTPSTVVNIDLTTGYLREPGIESIS